MTQKKVTRFQRLIDKELKGTGLEYRFECGPKHRKLFIEGKMVLVFSHGANAQGDILNIKSHIRRALERKNADQGRTLSRA